MVNSRFLATGMCQKDVARYFRVGRSTISDIIPEVCEAIWEELAPTEMPKPDATRWRTIAEEFERRWNFPNCLGKKKLYLYRLVINERSELFRGLSKKSEYERPGPAGPMLKPLKGLYLGDRASDFHTVFTGG